MIFAVSEEAHFRLFMHLPLRFAAQWILEATGLSSTVASACFSLVVTAFFFGVMHTGNLFSFESRTHFRAGIVFGLAYEWQGASGAITTHIVHNAIHQCATMGGFIFPYKSPEKQLP